MTSSTQQNKAGLFLLIVLTALVMYLFAIGIYALPTILGYIVTIGWYKLLQDE